MHWYLILWHFSSWIRLDWHSCVCIFLFLPFAGSDSRRNVDWSEISVHHYSPNEVIEHLQYFPCFNFFIWKYHFFFEAIMKISFYLIIDLSSTLVLFLYSQMGWNPDEFLSLQRGSHSIMFHQVCFLHFMP